MKFDSLQTDFSGGELSPRAQGRIQAAIYRAGASRIANCFVTESGSVASRGGGRLMAEYLGNNSPGTFDPTLIQSAQVFPVKDGPFPEEKYSLTLAGFDWRLFDKHGLPVNAYEPFPGTQDFATSGDLSYFDDIDNALHFFQTDNTVAFGGGTNISFSSGVGPTANPNFTVAFEVHGDPVNLRVFESGHADAINAVYAPGKYKVAFSVSANNVSINILFGQTGSFQKFHSKIFDIVILREGMDGTGFGSAWDLGNAVGYAGGPNSRSVSFWANGFFHIVVVGPGSGPTVVKYSPPATPGTRNARVWTMELLSWNSTAITNNASTSEITGVAAFQERLWFITNDSRGSVSASKVGYGPLVGSVTKFEFGNISAPPKAVEAMQLNLVSPNGVCRWIAVLRGMALGTSHREMLFSQDVSLSLDPVTGAAFDITEYSHYGAASNLPAIEVMDRIVFAVAGAQRVRMMGLQFESQGGFGADDISLFAEHLLKPKIVAMAHVRAPASRIFFVLNDGTAAVCTLVARTLDGVLAGAVSSGFNRHTIGAAWSRMSLSPLMTKGLYSVSGLDTDSGSELWAGTKDGMLLQFKSLDSTPFYKTTPNGVVYDKYEVPVVLDGWARAPLQNVGGARYCLGLPRTMVGKTVSVIGAGQYLGDFAVTDDGTGHGRIDLPALGLDVTWTDPDGLRQATTIYAGFKYPEHRLVTLPLEGGNPAGTSQGYQSRRVQLYLRLVDSYLPKAGGFRANERDDGDPMDALAGRVTGDFRVTQLGFARGATLEISQDVPLRFEISAIFGGTQVQSA